MTALAMVLAAGMVLGDGPEKVSAEMERGLDLSGEWEGTWQISGGAFKHFSLSDGELGFWDFSLPSRFHIEDQKGRHLRIRWSGRRYLGIYEQMPSFANHDS
jgi:hypothetical protein